MASSPNSLRSKIPIAAALLLFLSACQHPPRVEPRLNLDEQAWVAPDGHRMSFSFWASSTSEPRGNILALHGFSGRDVFVDAEVVQSFFEFNRPESLPFLKLRRFEEAYHLLLFDPLTPEVIEEIERFLLREDLQETR